MRTHTDITIRHSLEDIQHKVSANCLAPTATHTHPHTNDTKPFPFQHLVDDGHPSPPASEAGDINFIYRIMRSKRSRQRSRFLERFWAIRDMRYTRLNAKRKPNAKAAAASPTTRRPPTAAAASDATDDIPLQCLNAHLLMSATDRRERRRQQQQQQQAMSDNPSPASSSLDLEWEHEAGASQRAAWLATADESEATSQSTGSSGSSDSSATSSSRRQLVPPPPQQHHHQQAHSTIVSRLFRGTESATAESIPLATHARTGKCLSRTNSWSTHRSTPDSLEWDVNADEPTTSAQQQQQLFALRSSDEDLLDTDTMELLQEIEWLKNQALSETGATFRDSPVLLEAES